MRANTYEELCQAIGHVVANIAEDPDRPDNGADWSRMAGFSRYHFHRSFLLLAGESPEALRRRILLERAAHGLLTTGESLSSLSSQAGFSSQAAFCHAFTSRYAMPPAQFRKSLVPTFWQAAPNGLHYMPEGCTPFLPLARPGARPEARLRCLPNLEVLGMHHPGIGGYGKTALQLEELLCSQMADADCSSPFIYTHDPKSPGHTWRLRGAVGFLGISPKVNPNGTHRAKIGGGGYLVKRFEGNPLYLADFWARAWHQDAPRLGVSPRMGNAFNRILRQPLDRSGGSLAAMIFMPVRAKLAH